MSCTATAELPESKLGVSSAVVRIGTEKSQGCIRSDRRGEISLIRICDGRFLIQRLEGSRPSVGWSDRSLEVSEFCELNEEPTGGCFLGNKDGGIVCASPRTDFSHYLMQPCHSS
jgi:hypothetical protein